MGTWLAKVVTCVAPAACTMCSPGELLKWCVSKTRKGNGLLNMISDHKICTFTFIYDGMIMLKTSVAFRLISKSIVVAFCNASCLHPNQFICFTVEICYDVTRTVKTAPVSGLTLKVLNL